MRFLKTLLWIILIVLLLVFSINNWVSVTVNLWSGLQLDTKLPVLVITAFLAGFLPLWLLHRASRWRLNRRIASLESSHASLSAAPPAPSPAPASGAPAQSTPLSSV
ncbi:MAG: LapA family protein [Blastomonas sp.]